MIRSRFGGGVALALLAALVAAFVAGPAAAGEYRNAKFQYAITFPNGWRVSEDARNDAVIAKRPDGNVELAVQALDLQGKVVSADALADLFTARIFTNFRFAGKQPEKLGGFAGVAAAYTGKNNGKAVAIGAFYLVQGRYGFVLYAAMPADQAKVISKQLDPVFESFRRTTAGSPPRTATVSPPAAAPLAKLNVPAGVDFGRYYALVIGNTGYTAFPELKTAGADAQAIAALLRGSYGYETKVILNATRNQVIDAIEGYRAKLGKGDNLLIFYAGHGWLDEKAERGYWLPVDATPDSKANWISNTTITDSLKAMDARHVMVVADSCFSGTLTRGIKIQRRDADYFKRLAGKKARVAMTSGGLEPVSDAGGQGHSAFAQAFLDALAANNGVLDGTELFKRIERPVKLNADQTPAYADIRKAGHEAGGDFLFVRRR